MNDAGGNGRQEKFLRLTAGLKLPVIVAPMFTISGPALVTSACKAGVIGSFPAANARTLAQLRSWLEEISAGLGEGDAPWAVNLIVHSTNDRLPGELELIRDFRPHLVITSLGTPARIVEQVHDYGGLVFADVINSRVGRKALDAGADGLVLVCAGAGGHTGTYSPFAFVSEVRSYWDGPVVLSGAISNARSIRAAQVLGADLAYMGTAFIAAKESLAAEGYGQMLIESGMEDTITTDAVTGVNANWLFPSLQRAGIDLPAKDKSGKIDFSSAKLDNVKVWKELWGAGQGVGSIEEISPTAEIVTRLIAQYHDLEAEEHSTLPQAISGGRPA